jgi:hypothetical protein
LTYAEQWALGGGLIGISIVAAPSIAADIVSGGGATVFTPAEVGLAFQFGIAGAVTGYIAGSIVDYNLAREKYKKPPNPNQRKGAENRKPTGIRERNIGHPDGEEHGKRPKGNPSGCPRRL